MVMPTPDSHSNQPDKGKRRAAHLLLGHPISPRTPLTLPLEATTLSSNSHLTSKPQEKHDRQLDIGVRSWVAHHSIKFFLNFVL